jgi:Raf kinase inhibitor-like YbhB/YbcL family protein
MDLMKKNEIIIFIIALTLGIFTYFILGKAPMQQSSLTLTSSSFTNGGAIPRKYTCDGENISPQFAWNKFNAENLKSYVLIADDPDAQKVAGKTFVHWIALLPSGITSLDEGFSLEGGSSVREENNGVQELKNDFGHRYYGGPCPPSGTHTYRFTLFATTEPLDAMVTDFYRNPFTADAFRKHMGSKILAEATMTGTYTRNRSE